MSHVPQRPHRENSISLIFSTLGTSSTENSNLTKNKSHVLPHNICHSIFSMVGLKRTYCMYKFWLKRTYGMYKFRLKRTYSLNVHTPAPNDLKTLPMGILHDYMSCWTTQGPFRYPRGPQNDPKQHQKGLEWLKITRMAQNVTA